VADVLAIVTGSTLMMTGSTEDTVLFWETDLSFANMFVIDFPTSLLLHDYKNCVILILIGGYSTSNLGS